MPALNRALALEQVHGVAVGIGEDLDLDVPRLFDQPLDVERAVAERRLGFAPRRRERVRRSAAAADRLHADAAAARRRLDQPGKPTRSAARPQRLVGLIAGRLPGHDWHPGRGHQRAGADLRSHLFERRRGRADEDQAGLFARARERRALRQKAVARMDGVGAATIAPRR